MNSAAGAETELYTACLYAESPEAKGGGTGVFALPAPTSTTTAQLPGTEETEPATSVQQPGTAAAGGPCGEHEAAAPGAGRLQGAAVLPPSSAGSGGWLTGKGRAAHVPAATTSRFAALFGELEEVAELAAAAVAEPKRDSVALVTPPPAAKRNGEAEPPPSADAAVGWSTSAGHAEPASATSLAHAAELLFDAMPAGSFNAAAAAAALTAKQAATAPTVAVPDAAPALAPMTSHERQEGGLQPVGSLWETAKGDDVQISAAAAVQAAAVLGPHSLTVTDAGHSSKAMRDRSGSLWSTAKGDAVQVSAEAIVQAAATMGSIGSVTSDAPEGAAVSVVARQPLAAAAAETPDEHIQDAMSAQGTRKRPRRARRSQHVELEASAALDETASPTEEQPPASGFPVVDMMPTPPRRAVPSLHRAAVERSARGVAAAGLGMPARKGRSAFRSPLQTLSAAQQVCSG